MIRPGEGRPRAVETVTSNPNWQRSMAWDAWDAAAVERFQASLPGFQRTPLVESPNLAALLGAARVFVKHEQERVGLPSFKIMGASWAVNWAIADKLGLTPPATFADCRQLAERLPAGTTLSTATDGNHGRAIARLARLLDLPSRIYVPAGTASSRIAAIREEMAEVQIVEGSYDDAVRHSAEEAKRDGLLLVSDTAWEGYEEIPRRVVEGYGTIFREACDQLSDFESSGFAIAFVPAGVGSLASSAVQVLSPLGCDVVAVEPVAADCLRRSIEAGRPTAVPGPHGSIMAGLNCGEVSRVAWPVLREGLRAAVSVTDDEAAEAMRLLAAEDLPSGESGAASLAGARRFFEHQESPLPRGDGEDVLLVDTEGVTDPARYLELIGGTKAPSDR